MCQRFSKRWLCKEYVGRKVNNAAGVNLYLNFAFRCNPPFSLPQSNPTLDLRSNSKNQYLVSGQHKKNHLTLIVSNPEPTIWLCETGQWIPCFDSCLINHNMDLLYTYRDLLRSLKKCEINYHLQASLSRGKPIKCHVSIFSIRILI